MLKSLATICLSFAAAAACHGGCAASSESSDAGLPVEEVVCHDARYKSVFDKDETACRAYLDTCLGKLTPAQRATWDTRVNTCIQTNTGTECFAEVPWC